MCLSQDYLSKMKSYQKTERVELVFSGVDYFKVLEKIIDEAREVLHLQTYIFVVDNTGQKIITALKRAALRNVKVYMLIDAYGSFPFPKDCVTDLRNSGIFFRMYSPLFSSESIYLGRRLHHKIIVADKKTALTGGINIADKYSGSNGEKPWLDYAVKSDGAVCNYLHVLCESFYHKRSSKALKLFETSPTQSKDKKEKLIRYRRNDWIKGKNEIHQSYMEAVINAKTSITIVASYFLPGSAFRKLLKEAAQNGVQIKIILAGMSDIPSLRLAEHFLYDFYLKNKIQIYEWKYSVMHGKAMICDSQWVTIGSYNLNFLSHYISIELNSDIVDPTFASMFSEHLRDVINNNCDEVDLKKTENKRSLFYRFKQWIAYHFYKSLMNFMKGGRRYKQRKH